MINPELEKLIRKHVPFPVRIVRRTDIFNELQIRKDKIADFFSDYSSTFQVDVSGLDLNPYFMGNKRLTVGDLEKGISLGILNDNVVMLERNNPQPPKWTLKNIITTGILLIIITAILCYVAFYS